MSISPLAVSGAFLFGLCVGSFLNVCIWRLPAGQQVIRGRSRCMVCAKTIRWYDNIPLLSFLLLRGRCRNCGSRIAWTYPFVELATGVLLAGIVARFGLTPIAAVYGWLGAVLILLSMVDLREMILPDELTLTGLPVAFVLSYFFPALHGMESGWGGLWAGFLGALAGAGVLWGVGAVGSALFRREAMGLGDVKLMALVGAVIGWPQVLLVNLLLAPLIGSAAGIWVRMRYRLSVIPYGPFLSLGTLLAIFWGDAILAWYMKFWTGA